MVAAASGRVLAEDVGTAVKVVPGATVTRSGKAARLSTGQTLASGDVVSTDRAGQVQLLFTDGTKMAVGPGSSLSIDDIRMRPNGTADKFVVSAVAGGFRFLTGKSAKSAYSVRTPTATMGIRGTAFDFVVRNRVGTDLVLFSGIVRMCGISGNCLRVTGRCTAARTSQNGAVSAISAQKEKQEMILDGFSFVTRQPTLSPDFRTNVRSCGRDIVALPVNRSREDRNQRATPQPPEPPTPPGPPDPPDPPIRPDPPGGRD